MPPYQNLIKEAQATGIQVYEFDFTGQLKGLYIDGAIAIAKDLAEEEALCVLAEELGHHHTSYGDITDQAEEESRRQEKRARRWAHEKLLPIESLIEGCIACEGGERWELAEYMGVSDAFLCEALKGLQEKYGHYKEVGDYCVYFDPLTVAFYRY